MSVILLTIRPSGDHNCALDSGAGLILRAGFGHLEGQVYRQTGIALIEG